jgi:hypothetical protein
MLYDLIFSSFFVPIAIEQSMHVGPLAMGTSQSHARYTRYGGPFMKLVSSTGNCNGTPSRALKDILVPLRRRLVWRSRGLTKLCRMAWCRMACSIFKTTHLGMMMLWRGRGGGGRWTCHFCTPFDGLSDALMLGPSMVPRQPSRRHYFARPCYAGQTDAARSTT